ncbi:flagellar protein FlhE [Pseudomonas syringae]|uniref:flagellar protein FlhE n=1 Tax=Pseudomonas syringae TaxID=317 RepID=UPI001EFB3EE0|nr:flagellar protein FlhE [Pseudomonas syringae]
MFSAQTYAKESNMKLDCKKLKWISSVPGIALVLLASLDVAMAGSYQSSAALPVIHSKGYLHTIELPVSRHVPPAAMIKNTSWSWNVAGWPQGLEVYLCQGVSLCLDITRQRTGSTTFFDNRFADRKFHYAIRVGAAGRVPVAGQQGRVTVNW